MADDLEEKMQEMEVDNAEDELDESEAADGVGPLGGNDELWQKIRDEKKAAPGMFVSAWEEDEEGIEAKNMDDPKEQFLTAAEEGNLDKIKQMIEKYPDFLHVRDGDFYTPLHRAAYNNHGHVCKYLLQIGADPEARTEDGWTVLHCAACWANYEIVGILLSHGVDVNAQSHGNLTPLHLAINSKEEQQKQLITVKYLLEASGIDMGAKTKAGDTPLQLAHRNSGELYELLQSFIRRP